MGLVYSEPFEKMRFDIEKVKEMDGKTFSLDTSLNELITRCYVALDLELKRFLNFLGLNIGNDTKEGEIRNQMQISGIELRHIITPYQPKMSGFYVYQYGELLAIITYPFYEDGKVKIMRIIPEDDNQGVTH